MLVKELINAAGRLIGELRSGRSFADDELADLLVSLNNMLGEWSEEQFGIYRVTVDTVTLNGAATYTYPAAGNRPVRILSAATRTSAGIERPADVLNAQAWAARVRDANETGLFAEAVWPDWNWPVTVLRVWPRPASGSLVLAVLAPLTSFPGLTATVDLPVGYEEGLIYGFAMKIAPEFNKEPSQAVVATAARARQAIAASNAQLLPPVPAPPVAVPA